MAFQQSPKEGTLPLSRERIAELLRPYRVVLGGHALWQIETYVELLARWNEKINLTAIRNREEMVTRHFGESLLLASGERLEGRLLDIGSGAGFPGLALKIACPGLEVTLLEPVGKKRAFLLETVRVCSFARVTVRRERLEAIEPLEGGVDTITARAVGNLGDLVEYAKPLLSESGRLCLWISRLQAINLRAAKPDFNWAREISVPGTFERVILIGSKCLPGSGNTSGSE